MKKAFTLIELLSSMAVLALIVIMLATMLTRSTEIFTRGHKQITTSEGGRNACDLLRQDLSSADVDENCPFWFKMEEQTSSVLGTNAAIYCLASVSKRNAQDAGVDRREVSFFVIKNKLGRGSLIRFEPQTITRTTTANAKTTPQLETMFKNYRLPTAPNQDYYESLADNIFEFKVECFDSAGFPLDVFHSMELDHSNKVPAIIDVSILLLDESDWKKTNYLQGDKWLSYARLNSKRYSTRISIPLAETY